MFGLLTWVLLGIILYTAVAMGLSARGYLPSAVSVTGPLTTIHTKRGRAALNRIAQRKRFWRAWGNLGVGIALVVMAIAGLAVVLSVPAVFAQPDGAGTLDSPENALVIPGVNDFLPLSAAPAIVFGLLVGLVVHEGGHGLLCRVEDIEIESMGVALFTIIPVGAFVEPDADDQQAADRGAQTRMFAAGITNNFAICAISALLLVPLAASVAVVPGAPVGTAIDGSGAAAAGIEHGDVITEIDGTPVENASELEAELDRNAAATVEVDRRNADSVTVNRRLLILEHAEGVADDIVDVDPLTQVTAVNGTTVNTEPGFAAVVENRAVATLETTRGNATIPVGAYIAEVTAGSALAEAGLPTDGTSVTITRIDGTRTANASAYESVLDSREPGTELRVEAYVGGERRVVNATVDGDGSFGVPETVLAKGYSGFVFDDFGADPYPAEQFLSFLDGSNAAAFPTVTSVLVYFANLLVLPFATLLDPSVSYNFAGFNGEMTAFFVIEGPLSALGGLVFTAINLLFWTWWVNFNLALFNCIPAFPLDGGHILRTSSESVVSRLPVPNRRLIVTLFTSIVTIGMVFAVLVMVFGPALLV
ncbi:metalloprotease [Halovenus sp. WSH3]|uniref:Metalloprotease n=1 Tax=Halovenus carboxidivorans TaxID=2692199 RepID=A0A6B0T902_9EURY|nr:site-2 protease family protein [Halovenus carboxidivorans]MXR51822.1 metalloprotease [Halovenus carboxidivorans]